MTARASVVIPAHDEATTLGRLLTRIESAASEFEIVVVANGCSDDTAEVARRHPVTCTVLELGAASKSIALNAGDEAVSAFPRIYLDADVTVEAETLRRLAAELDGPRPLIGSPAVRIDETGASLAARAYQRIWGLTDFRLEAHTGSGVYAVSRAGRARFESFPDVISDDLYVRLLFAPDERVVTSGTPFVVFAPRTLRAQIRRLARTMAGELQVHARFPGLGAEVDDPGSARRRLLQRVVARPVLWPSFVIYAFAYALGRLGARRKLALGREHVWERDETTR